MSERKNVWDSLIEKICAMTPEELNLFVAAAGERLGLDLSSKGEQKI